MKWAFKEISNGLFSTEQIFHRAVEKGLKCSKNNFLRLIRNPFYIDIIQIHKFKDEDAYEVKGVHELLIAGSLFHDVQDILNGNKRKIKTKIISDELLPLKGFIRCANCGRALCGSASKGRNGSYYYYRCSSKCGIRFKPSEVNAEYETFIAELKLRPALANLLKTAILDTYGDQSNELKEETSILAKKLTQLTTKLSRARELLLI